MDENILNNDEYLNTVRDVLLGECPIPEYYHFLDSQQIQSSNISLGSDRIIKWYSNLTDVPTLKVNDFNTVSTIKFQRQIVKINYLPFQYAFKYYAPDGKVSVEANTNITMREGLLGSIIEIQKLMSAHYLKGGLALSKGNKRTLLVDEFNNETMYGLLNLPNQIDKTVKQPNILDQIRSINDDLLKINLEDERRVPFKILTTSKIKGRLLERLPNNNYSYKDMLFDFISAINNDANIELETTNLLDNEILIYPRSSKLLLLKDGHQPILNSYTEVSSSNFRTSFLDFSIGTILATKNSILRIKLS
ncbi:hypothetical protein [Borreliella turdi]|uniref:hypothetical protein n=1 Tax=Borreliella turdi TaxID=57863 RepID=UPI0012441863|nr:hypothetical protein [Borreliella turdi]